MALSGLSEASSPSSAEAGAWSWTFSIKVFMDCLNSSSAGGRAGAGVRPGAGVGSETGAEAGSAPGEVVPGGTFSDSEHCLAKPAAEPHKRFRQ